MPPFTQITPAQAMRRIGLPEAVEALPRRIPTARRVPHSAIDRLTDPPLACIGACRHGRKLSEGAAAPLRRQGWQAEVLEGGTAASAAAGLPMLPIGALPASNLWVTRHRPKIDRIACPRAIRRFIDPGARFPFDAPAEVAAIADRFGAAPCDVEGAALCHRGDGCSFDALLDDFALRTEPLDRLARVVRAADTNRHDLAPQAAGLLAVSVGLSRMFRDDLNLLALGSTLYDALYRWARDGHEEGHDWPTGRQA